MITRPIFAFLVLLLPYQAAAQSLYGSLVGNLSDSSAGAVAGAQIKVVYGDGKGMFDELANISRSLRFLETVAANSSARYKWPHPLTLKMESCGHPGTDYDDETRIVTICYETPFDFAELYRAYV